MEPSTISAQLRSAISPRLDTWDITASVGANGQWTLTLTHPASAGLVLESIAADGNATITAATNTLRTITEVDIAAAAPKLEHLDLIAGLRTIAKAFNWDTLQVRSVAFLLFENGHLTHDEAAWLGGYDGQNAPMAPISPTG